MESIHHVFDLVLHLNAHLDTLLRNYGGWIYLILFMIVFCETGLVVTPFLPGDSLLFAVGALCGAGSMDLWTSLILLLAAAVLGDTVNYWSGYWAGPKVFRKQKSRWFNPEHLRRTHAFTEKYGGKAIVLARFLPIVRTFAPFVAGVGRMTYSRFMVYNVAGGILWVAGFLLAGYFFGNLEFVQRNFSTVIFAIIAVSVVPGVIEFIRHRRELRRKSAAERGV